MMVANGKQKKQKPGDMLEVRFCYFFRTVTVVLVLVFFSLFTHTRQLTEMLVLVFNFFLTVFCFFEEAVFDNVEPAEPAAGFVFNNVEPAQIGVSAVWVHQKKTPNSRCSSDARLLS
jgi:hypothetical protein